MIPRNEMEVVAIFSQQAQTAGFEIVSMQAGFPDAVVRQGETSYRVEFEHRSSNFSAHRHDPEGCDLIICWVNDEEYPILPTIELSNPNWPNIPISSLVHREELAGYWKKRALISERRLEAAERIMPKVIEATIELLYIVPEAQNIDKQGLALEEMVEWYSPLTEKEKKAKARLLAKLQKPQKVANK